MQLSNFFAVALLATGALAADFHCTTKYVGKNAPKDSKATHKFSFSEKDAKAAMQAGGTTVDKSGFPHAFGGGSSDGGSNTGGGGGSGQLKFYGADNRCNQKNPKLLEFPILFDGKISKKGGKRGGEGTPSPARVVYLQDGKTLCGVMTHVLEDYKGHQGKGNFRVCDK